MSGSNDRMQTLPVKAVAILSGKGGTGKSIICASIGCVLAQCGFRTVLIDTDLFTAGLSFYVLSDNPRRAAFGLQEVFLKGVSPEKLEAIKIVNWFTDEHLSLLPAISRGKVQASELNFPECLTSVRGIVETLEKIIKIVGEKCNADIVILDTRGGTDPTSVGAAIAAGGFAIVTEADKTSWDVGSMLLENINTAAQALDKEVARHGFIINKNVLPAEAIIAFLRRQWLCPYLATIPLDTEAVRAFQEDKIPVLENIASDFSISVLEATGKLLDFDQWPDDNKKQFKLLRLESAEKRSVKDALIAQEARSERAAVLIRFYIFALFALAVPGFIAGLFDRKLSYWISALSGFAIFTVLILTDRQVTRNFIDSLSEFIKRLKRPEIPRS